MQAEEKTTMGIELDESASIEDGETDEGTPFSGSELDEDTQAGAVGIELDDAIPAEGNQMEEGTPFSGSELDDDVPEGAEGKEDPIPADPSEDKAADDQADQGTAAETPVSGNRRKLIIAATAGLCTLALGAAMYGTLVRPVETAAPPTTPTAIAAKSSQDFEGFVIPFHRENKHYLSISISLESADGTVLHELKEKEAIIRGRLYDLLKAYAEQAAGYPSLAATKEMVAGSINAWLSAGRVDGVYITRFVIN
jgi:flagellar FliL protein